MQEYGGHAANEELYQSQIIFRQDLIVQQHARGIHLRHSSMKNSKERFKNILEELKMRKKNPSQKLSMQQNPVPSLIHALRHSINQKSDLHQPGGSFSV